MSTLDKLPVADIPSRGVAEKRFVERAKLREAEEAVTAARDAVTKGLKRTFRLERALEAKRISADECWEEMDKVFGEIGRMAGRKRKADEM